MVLDTNLLFSALITAHGPPGLIYSAWRQKRYELATCEEQIAEIRRASRYPRLRMIVEPQEVGRMLNNMRRAKNFGPLLRKHQAEDSADSYLLDLADASEADYLVTGDKRAGLLQRGRVGKASIVTPSIFCGQVLRLF